MELSPLRFNFDGPQIFALGSLSRALWRPRFEAIALEECQEPALSPSLRREQNWKLPLRRLAEVSGLVPLGASRNVIGGFEALFQ